MTVDDLIEKLTEVSKLGHGSYTVEAFVEDDFGNSEGFAIQSAEAFPDSKKVLLAP